MRIYGTVIPAAVVYFLGVGGGGADASKLHCTANGVVVDDMFGRWLEYDGRIATDGNDIALFDNAREQCYLVRGGTGFTPLRPGESVADIELDSGSPSSSLLSRRAERAVSQIAGTIDLFVRGKRELPTLIESLSLFPDEINLRNVERAFSALKNMQRKAGREVESFLDYLAIT